MKNPPRIPALLRPVGCALLTLAPALSQAAGLPQVPVPSVHTPYQLDGRLDESFWQEAPVQTNFHSLGDGEQSRDISESTSFRVVRHGGILLFGFVCKQPDAEVSVRTTQRDATTICADDSVEIFLRHNDKGFYQFAVNAGGALYDQFISTNPHANRTEWTGAWEAAVHRGKDQWSVEIAIPVASLNAQEAADAKDWFLNAARTWSKENIYQSWAPVKTGFGDWPYHRRLRFEGIPPVPSSFLVSQTDFPDFLYGKNSKKISVSAPPLGGPFTMKTSLRSWEPGSLPARKIQSQNLRAAEGKLTLPLDLTIPLAQSASRDLSLHELILEIVDERTKETVALIAHTFQLPELLHVRMDPLVHFPSDRNVPVQADLNAANPTSIASTIQITLSDSAGRTVWEETQDVGLRKDYAFQIPVENRPADLYRVQVSLQSPQAHAVTWSGRFQLVPGPFPHPKKTDTLKSKRK